MNQVTKKQHYVWRHYLAPWTDNNSSTGKIACLRNNKVFTTSLTNIAHENYFYEAKKPTEQEKALVRLITGAHASDVQKKMNEEWLEFYCAPSDLADLTSPLFPLFEPQEIKEKSQVLKDIAIEHVENLHSVIESTGIDFLERLRKNDISFWENEDDREKFSFYLCNQYFRTKRSRDAIIKAFILSLKGNEYFKDICPDNIWIPLTLIFASNVGLYVAHNFSAVLLRANADFFIVGDQPVVNTHSTFDISVSPDAMELFYPITPKLGLLMTMDSQYASGEIKNIPASDVKKYNSIEFKVSREQIFAKDKTQLELFID